MVYSGYDDDAHLLDYESKVRQTVRALRDVENRYDVIAVRGMSGSLIGGPVSLILKKPLFVVRKHGDSHAGEAPLNGGVVKDKRCLFVDDFVSSGGTRRAVAEAVERYGGTVVGSYLYEHDDLHI